MDILIADSGGTKTDWLGSDGREKQTIGLNPNQVDEASARRVLTEEVKPWLQGQPEKIYFFGAGLGTELRKKQMDGLLRLVFPQADIRTETDLMGAAYACLGRRPGVTGILGTGSVAFRYDGRAITERRGGLGYLLGDEGGGTSLGRSFLRVLLGDGLPGYLEQAYMEHSGLDRERLMATLYNHPQPQRFLAELVPLLARFRDRDSIRTLLLKSLLFYVEEVLRPLHCGKEPIVLMGGITRAFPELVAHACSKAGLHHATILEQNPIRMLAQFLTQEEGT